MQNYFGALAVEVILGLLCSFAAAAIGFAAIGSWWMRYNDLVQEFFTLNPAGQFGTFLVLFSVGVGPLLLGYAVVALTRIKATHPKTYISSLLLLASATTIGVIFAGVTIDASSPHTWYQGPEPKLNTLNQLLGGCLVAVYTPLGLTMYYIATKFVREKFSSQSTKVESGNGNTTFDYDRMPMNLQSKLSFMANTKSIGIIVAAFLFIFFLTLFLPHTWAITYMPLITPSAYFVLDSPYSLVHGALFYVGDIEHYSWQNISHTNVSFMEDNLTQIEYNDTWYTEEYLPNPDYLQPMVYLKLYPDVVVYYSFLLLVIAVGVAGTYWLPVRRLLHRRMRVDWIPKAVSLWPLGATLGELLLLAGMIGLHAYWFWYWSKGWEYRITEIVSPHINLQLWANVMGEMAILTMSFLTFPVTHNSVWESVFGVPFDR